MILAWASPFKVNNDLKLAILNLIDLIFFKSYPSLSSSFANFVFMQKTSLLYQIGIYAKSTCVCINKDGDISLHA